MKTMAAAKFKANILSVLKEVEGSRESVVVTRNGKPVAKLVPLDLEEDPLAAFRFPGHVEVHGDIVSSPYSDVELNAFYDASADQLR